MSLEVARKLVVIKLGQWKRLGSLTSDERSALYFLQSDKYKSKEKIILLKELQTKMDTGRGQDKIPLVKMKSGIVKRSED